MGQSHYRLGPRLLVRGRPEEGPTDVDPTHRFEDEGDRVVMRDRVEYDLPLGLSAASPTGCWSAGAPGDLRLSEPRYAEVFRTDERHRPMVPARPEGVGQHGTLAAARDADRVVPVFVLDATTETTERRSRALPVSSPGKPRGSGRSLARPRKPDPPAGPRLRALPELLRETGRRPFTGTWRSAVPGGARPRGPRAVEEAGAAFRSSATRSSSIRMLSQPGAARPSPSTAVLTKVDGRREAAARAGASAPREPAASPFR